MSIWRPNSEAGVVLDRHGLPIYWHVPENRTETALPDSSHLWEVIWKNRKNFSGFAHSHPGSGFPSPSHTDITTFSAIEAALGRDLDWWIASSNAVTFIKRMSTGDDGYFEMHMLTEAFPWVDKLRKFSGFLKNNTDKGNL